MPSNDLIIDVGMHRGEDTDFYLAKGFKVIAIEANPTLVESANRTFRKQIQTGHLTVIHAAIANDRGTARLAVSDENTIWSSLSPEFIARNERFAGTRYRHVDVPAILLEDVLSEYGIPYYLKIDIEGLDMLCVRALREFGDRPAYLSLESNVTVNQAPLEDVFDELAELWSLGYRRFKYVNQSQQSSRRLRFPSKEGRYVDYRFTPESSGPFGAETPGTWRPVGSALAVAQLLRLHHNLAGLGGRWARGRYVALYQRARERMGRPIPWYDLHARLAP